MVPIHPGRILRRELNARRPSANALARALRVPSGRIVDILNGKTLGHGRDRTAPRALFRQRSAILDQPAGSVRSRRCHARCRAACGARSPDSRMNRAAQPPLTHGRCLLGRTRLPTLSEDLRT